MMFAAAGGAMAQENSREVARGDAAFVVQAPGGENGAVQTVQSPAEAPAEIAPPPRADASSKVYFPDAITPQSVARARAQAAQQEQLPRSQAGDNATFSQVSSGGQNGQGDQNIGQLTEGQSGGALAQLSPAEQQVLLEAVEGTDICDRATDIPALQELCEGRLENRSADFTKSTRGSAEDSLLGGGLDNARIATLEAAISRLARNVADTDDFSSQVIASVALGSSALTGAQATSAEAEPGSELSDETQAVVAAIVQQLGGN